MYPKVSGGSVSLMIAQTPSVSFPSVYSEDKWIAEISFIAQAHKKTKTNLSMSHTALKGGLLSLRFAKKMFSFLILFKPPPT